MDSVVPKPATLKAKKEVRNWLNLPHDVIFLIFLKLGPFDIMFSAQSVCSSWRLLSKDPQLFRCIDMRRLIRRRDESTLTKLVVDRSCGQLVDFTLTNTADEFLFCYVIDRSNLLKCFRLVRSEIYGEDVADAAKKLPSLEELELCHCMLGRSDIRDIGRSCTQLKYLRLNGHRGKERPLERDEEAFAIAESMPELRGLHLYGNKCMTNEGLQAILDGCPYLEYLNLRRCTGIDTSGELLKNRLGRIKNVRLPDDPTDDYELDDVDHVSDPYFDDYPSPPNYDDEGNYLSDYDYDYDYDYEQLLQ